MTSASEVYFDPSMLSTLTTSLSQASLTDGVFDLQSSSGRPIVNVAYQGEPGAYSEQAVRQLFQDSPFDVHTVPCASFSAVFATLASHEARFVLVPIENSLGGSIHDNYDLLLRHKVTCIAELQFRVSHCLLALPGTDIKDIKTAYSHPQALAQCEGYLSKLGITPEKQYDTAGSAKMIAERGLKNVAAIASELAGTTYGLEVIARKIEDDEGNYTRFLLLAPTTTQMMQAAMYAGPQHASPNNGPRAFGSSAQSSPTTRPTGSALASPIGSPRFSPMGSPLAQSRDNVANLSFNPVLTRTTFKTSLVFTLPDVPGSLFKALSVFALRDLHMCKIESRPCKEVNFIHEEQLHSFAEVKKSSQAASSDVPCTAAAVGVSGERRNEFKYLFFLDALSSLSQNESLKNGLRHLKEYTPFLRVLGSYPVFQALSEPDAVASSAGAQSGDASPSPSKKLRIGIIGFGTFGQFLAKKLAKQGHELLVHSRSDYSALSAQLGMKWQPSYAAMATAQPDVLIFAVSILSFAETVAAFPWESLKACLVVDVLSVKEHPKTVLLEAINKRGDKSIDILATHPMFGPDSGKYQWKGLPFMFERVRVAVEKRCDAFLNCFAREGCRMLEMTCEMHDQYAAGSQFLTHTTGRLLAQLQCTSTPINTSGYTKLLQVIEQTQKDSWELYAGLYKYNARSQEQLEIFGKKFDELRHKLKSTTSPAERSRAATLAPATVAFNPHVTSMNESKTVAIADLTKKLVAGGAKITSLSVGEVLSCKTPKVICDAAVRAMEEGHTTYTPVAGLLELRQAICAKLARENQLQYTADQIVVANGAKQAIYQSLQAVVTPDENEVIVPAPYWVSYPDMVTLVGGKPVIVDTMPDACVLTAAKLEAALTPRTKLLILCSPSNPTGVVYTRAQLEAIASVVRKHPRLLVLSDEIYEHLLFEGATHTSFAALPGMLERTITINGFSKGYVMTGFRVGYVAAPLPIARMCNKIQGQITSCSSSISQYAALAALTQLPAEFRTDLVAGLDQTRKMLLKELSAIPHLTFQPPTGAFYVLVDCSAYFGRKTRAGTVLANSDDLAMYLLDQHKVALVPGEAFGAPACLRISYASSDEIVLAGAKAMAAGFAELQA